MMINTQHPFNQNFQVNIHQTMLYVLFDFVRIYQLNGKYEG